MKKDDVIGILMVCTFFPLVALQIYVKEFERNRVRPVTTLVISKGIDEVSGLVHVPSVPTSVVYGREWLFPSTWTYQDPVKLPLVINLHGLGSNAFLQMELTDFNTIADENNFIVLYPNGRATAKLPHTLENTMRELFSKVWTVQRLERALIRHFATERHLFMVPELFSQGRSWNAGGC